MYRLDHFYPLSGAGYLESRWVDLRCNYFWILDQFWMQFNTHKDLSRCRGEQISQLFRKVGLWRSCVRLSRRDVRRFRGNVFWV